MRCSAVTHDGRSRLSWTALAVKAVLGLFAPVSRDAATTTHPPNRAVEQAARQAAGGSVVLPPLAFTGATVERFCRRGYAMQTPSRRTQLADSWIPHTDEEF
jgi:hypothetical protein